MPRPIRLSEAQLRSIITSTVRQLSEAPKKKSVAKAGSSTLDRLKAKYDALAKELKAAKEDETLARGERQELIYDIQSQMMNVRDQYLSEKERVERGDDWIY